MADAGLLTEETHPRLTDRRGLSAAWLFPVCGPPVRNGRVRCEGGRVVDVSRADGAADLPTSAVLPATVNLHTHLELSDIPGPVGGGLPLDRWVEEVVRYRAFRGRTGDEPAATAMGYEETRGHGSAAVLDVAQRVEPRRPGVVAAYEVLGLDPERASSRLKSVLEQTGGAPEALSPHAPYSLAAAVRDDVVRLSADRGCLVATHLAESPAERRLLERGDGPFADLLRRMGVWREGVFGGRTVAGELDALADAARLVVAHGNDLRPDEYERLARPDAAVAFCPRTHAFFGHGRHPFAEMLAAGVTVGLGTDSRASNPDLSVWNEVRFLRASRPDVPPPALVEMATRNGAAAMGLSDRLGAVAAGSQAAFLRVDLARPDAADPYEALFG